MTTTSPSISSIGAFHPARSISAMNSAGVRRGCVSAATAGSYRRVRGATALRDRSVGPEVLHELAVAALGPVGADRDDLKALRAALEGAHDRRRDAHDVPALEVDHLVVEAHAAGSADDDVRLLLLAVAMSVRRLEVRRVAEVGDAEVVGVEVLAPEARLQSVGARGRGVVDVLEVLDRESRHGGRESMARCATFRKRVSICPLPFVVSPTTTSRPKEEP